MKIKNSVKKRLLTTAVIFTFVFTMLFSACTSQKTAQTITSENTVTTTENTGTEAAKVSTVSVKFDSDDTDSTWDSLSASKINLNGNSISFQGTGATSDSSKLTITKAGTYVVSGSLSDGQIIINTDDEGIVKLVLNNADITYTKSSPVYIMKADKVILILAEGTKNKVTDTANYVFEDSSTDEPNAAIFSKSDLTINGSGSLTVSGNYKNGIASKDDLKITGGNITVTSVEDGIQGKDSVAVKDANITVNAKGDGIKSSNDKDNDKGYIYIDGNTLNITAAQDGIQAETNILINSGNIKISSGGGSANSINKNNNDKGGWNNPNDSQSTAVDNSDKTSGKGIKASVNITVNGGTLTIDSADDSIHSNDSIIIKNGTLTLASGDDGMHSDTSLEIDLGDITITKSYEGIESADIKVNGGNIHIASSDDAVNVSGGNDGSSTNGRPGQNDFTATSNSFFTINGGYLYCNANGDGLDSNGSIKMTGGTVIVNGPSEDNNGALDYNGTCTVTGGYILAVGSAGMAEAPDKNSTVNSVSIAFTSSMTAGTAVYIESSDGKDILTFVPAKQFQSVVLCSPELKKGNTYNIYYGGSAKGNAKDGLYSSATYTAGTKYTSFTVSDVVTTVGSYSGGPGGRGGNGGKRP